jgi:hypothetical protein
MTPSFYVRCSAAYASDSIGQEKPTAIREWSPWPHPGSTDVTS